MSESQCNSNAAQPAELAHQPPLMLPQTPLSPLAFSPGLPEYSPAYTLMPGFSIPPFSPLNSPLVPQHSQQQFFFPTSPPPFSPGPPVGGGGDFCHVCGPPAAQLCAGAAPPMQPPQAPTPGCWGAYQLLPPLSPLSPSTNTSFFPPMSLNCPPPPLFSPLQPPPPPPPAPAAHKTTLATRLRQTPNPRPSPRPHQPISIFNSPFKRFTQFRGTPSPVVFPMRQHDARQRREEVSVGSRGGWYKEGARWGHGGDHQELGSQTLR